jgi:hypothetical protein
MVPYAGVDYNLTLWPLQSLLQHIYHVRVDFIPSDFGFCLSTLSKVFYYHFSYSCR